MQTDALVKALEARERQLCEVLRQVDGQIAWCNARGSEFGELADALGAAQRHVLAKLANVQELLKIARGGA